MAEASWALQTSVYAALSANALLTTQLGGPKVFDDVPPGTAYPYVTLGESIARDWSAGDEPGLEHILTFHVWSRAKGRKGVHEIMGTVHATLHDQQLTVAGHRLINLRHEFSEARREADGETYHGIMRYRAVTEAES